MNAKETVSIISSWGVIALVVWGCIKLSSHSVEKREPEKSEQTQQLQIQRTALAQKVAAFSAQYDTSTNWESELRNCGRVIPFTIDVQRALVTGKPVVLPGCMLEDVSDATASFLSYGEVTLYLKLHADAPMLAKLTSSNYSGLDMICLAADIRDIKKHVPTDKEESDSWEATGVLIGFEKLFP